MIGKIEAIRQYSYQKLNHEYTGHDFFHSERVAKLAEKLAEGSNVSLPIILAACYLHDVIDDKVTDDPKRERESINHFLNQLDWPDEAITQVLEIIDHLSFSYEVEHGKAELSLEGKIVQDADRLDALGAVGILRTAYYGGSTQTPLHHPNESPRTFGSKKEYRKKGTVINHFYEKLFLLQASMNTVKGKAEAQRRTKIMEDFLGEFYLEWDGDLPEIDKNEKKI
ncbi:metal-dependent phosphohydrolase [Enterococcus florum]|uniref:Metal-dependent phosphohydrolase n=1 Tax=Enterococcus florum TaxID=2480627 RepID=A0A4P5PCI5_9ENTE|nr:HD domain-containing protein [Enterococcus florum]GCF93668.1 metal-dependent phosphohydrolase [Enterococcus florum]